MKNNLIKTCLSFGMLAATLGTVKSHAVPIDLSEKEFTRQSVFEGVTASQQSCNVIDHSGTGQAVWVEASLHGYQYQECIRYYQSGLSEIHPNPKVIVYFSGDVWTGHGIYAEYLKQSPEDKQAEVVQWSHQLHDLPYIFLARPGIYGSSGVHKGARKPLESLLMNAALNAIKQRYQIGAYTLVGHSSGGHVVASLLSKRRDIICAVASSAPSSPEFRAELRHSALPEREFEPVNSLTPDTPYNPDLHVFVVGDIHDQNTPWLAQKILYDRLTALHWPAIVINLNAADKSHHILADQARVIAGMCTEGKTEEEIKKAVSLIKNHNK